MSNDGRRDQTGVDEGQERRPYVAPAVEETAEFEALALECTFDSFCAFEGGTAGAAS